MTDALDSIADGMNDGELTVDGQPSTRRTVLRGFAVAGVVAGTPMLAAACGGEDETGGGTGGDTGDDTATNETEEEPETEETTEKAEDGDDAGEDNGGGADDGGDADGGGADAIAQASEIEVGGGMIIADEELVITQPEEGTFIGLSALCSHRGCLLSDVTDGSINCASDCGHGSTFDLNGAVTNGPATQPLPEVPLQVDGENITLA